jgi:hypothetical protein
MPICPRSEFTSGLNKLLGSVCIEAREAAVMSGLISKKLEHTFPVVPLGSPAEVLSLIGKPRIDHLLAFGSQSSPRINEWAGYCAVLSRVDAQSPAPVDLAAVAWDKLPPVELVVLDSTVPDPLGTLSALLHALGKSSCGCIEISIVSTSSRPAGDLINDLDSCLKPFQLERTNILAVESRGFAIDSISLLYKRSQNAGK